MKREPIFIQLHNNHRVYQPGETLAGEYRVDVTVREKITAFEVSVLWYTEGKGDEDFAVHHFERHVLDEFDPVDLYTSRPFSTVLPNSPLCYDGVILKIRWCVRVRLFLDRGKDLVSELPFQLGGLQKSRAFAS